MVLQQEPKLEQDIETHDNDVMMSESTGMLIRPPPLVQEDVKNVLHTNKIIDKRFPSNILTKFLTEFKTGQMYDAVWECQGGMFKVLTNQNIASNISLVLRTVVAKRISLILMGPPAVCECGPSGSVLSTPHECPKMARY